MNPKNKISKYLAQMARNVESSSFNATLSNRSIQLGTYTRTSDGNKKLIINQDIIVISKKLLDTLIISEIKMVRLICSELKRNNALWYFDYRIKKGSSERAILSLRKKRVLLKTPIKGLHLVNPFAIRRGGIHDVLAATSFECMKKETFMAKDIRDLKSPPKHEFNFNEYAQVDDLDDSLYRNF
jgi:hypothetical protein